MRHARGFTLIELMTVVVVAAILTGLAVSSYRNSMLRAQRTNATTALLNIASAQEKFFLQNNRYADNAERLAAPPGGLGIADPAGYTIRVDSADFTRQFTLVATATGTQAQDNDCASFTLTQDGLRTAQNSGGAANTERCWR
jgi:type IV pilus assembly protein PilE